VGTKSVTQLMFRWMYIMGQRDYMFRPVVAVMMMANTGRNM